MPGSRWQWRSIVPPMRVKMPAVTPAFERLPRRDETCQVPRSLGDGLVEVDATWGAIQPLEVAPGVRTVAELEVIEHAERGGPLVDTRLEHFHREGTIPGARSMPHEEIIDHVDELDPSGPTVFFCNGPQCPATPDAISRLLDHGYPATAILY
jgi:hypothetical protein